MKRYAYTYPLGVIHCLEKKIVPSKIFLEVVSYDLPYSLARFKDYFFQALPGSLESIEDIEKFLNKEKAILKALLERLVREEKLRKEMDAFFSYEGLNWEEFKDYPALEEIFKKRLDFYNIIFLLRAKYSKKKVSFRFFGFLEEKDLYKLEEDELLKITNPLYFDFLSLGKTILNNKEFLLLDYLPFRFLRKDIEEIKKIAFGPERIFYFYFLKSLESKIIKFILSCQLYKIEEEKIKKVLEIVYG